MVSPDKCIAGRSAADWIAAYPVVSDLCALKETAWVNPDKLPFAQAAAACPLTFAVIEDAVLHIKNEDPYLTLSGELLDGVTIGGAEDGVSQR